MSAREEALKNSLTALRSHSVTGWVEIASHLDAISDSSAIPDADTIADIAAAASRGTAFITFAYGIDGVTIEISKYVLALADALDVPLSRFHLISGHFHPHTRRLFRSDLPRFHLTGANGWSKWDGGKWFSGLYYQDMPQDSPASKRLASKIFSQAVSLSERLGSYILENDIHLLIPVNVASNPGNLAFAIALVIVSESLALPVINSNHDFYWEGGRLPGERPPGAPPGVRDHFFRNHANQPFFNLFRSLYPWNGRRWLQVNINSRQSARLVDRFGFSPQQVAQLPTSVPDALSEPYTFEQVLSARQRMARILANGRPVLRSISLQDHLDGLGEWMAAQHPIVIGLQTGLEIDPASPHLIYLLQPTRLIARKRIPRDIQLIHALLERSLLKAALESQADRQIILHITGPVPVEHQQALKDVLLAYRELAASLPEPVARRVFLAFSIGREEHPSFAAHGLTPLNIIDIYRMASLVLFPSLTEGRGLPIIESAAVGVPIICSRYRPESVFAAVVGEGLPADEQIRYTLFPEGDFTPEFLDRVAKLLLSPDEYLSTKVHNQQAVRARFSLSALTNVWRVLLEMLADLPLSSRRS